MDIIDVFKLLSDASRLRIMNLLHQQQSMCVCELEYVLGLSQPNLSKHLNNMKKLEIVDDTKRNKFVYYSINKNFLLNFPFVSGVLENEVKKSNICLQDSKSLKEYVNSDICCDTISIAIANQNRREKGDIENEKN